MSLGFDSEVDCCYQPTVGDEHFCASGNLCGVDEGNCYSNDECQTGLGCASCPSNLGFSSNTHCCTQRGVGNGGQSFCSYFNPCGIDEGDCNSDSHCKDSLICGTNNCPASFGFAFNLDCCMPQQSVGHEHFCRSNFNPCGIDEGDCDSNYECQGGLVCGSNNCPPSLGFDSEVDCCYQPTLGDEHFCRYNDICGENEGDCDYNDECQDGLVCASNSYCPASLGQVDCCILGIMSPNYHYGSYPNNVEETWLLTAPTGSIIYLEFQSFDVRLIVKSLNKTTNIETIIFLLHEFISIS